MTHTLIAGFLSPVSPEHVLAFAVNPPTGVNYPTLPAYVGTVVGALQNAFVGILFLALVVYAGMMILYSSEDSMVTESKSALAYAIGGCIVVGLAVIIGESVTRTGTLLDFSTVTPSLENIALYFRYALLAILLGNIVIQAFRLLASRGEQDVVARARKRLILGFVGAVIMIIAGLITNAASTLTLSDVRLQIVYIANAIVVLLTVACVAAMVIAGIMLVLSAQESLKERAKTIIRVAIVSFIVVLLSGTIVNTILLMIPSP
jgi:hypothetical protein